MAADLSDDLEFEAAEDAAAAGDALVLDIDGYEGPLHLLLELARMQKVDVTRISVLELAEQYLAFINRAQNLRIELAADYLVMAAWLAYLKSRLILPKPESDVPEPKAEEMAAHLAFRLQRLDAMRRAVQSLFSLARTGEDIFVRGAPEGLRSRTTPLYDAELFDILKAYGDIRSQSALRKYTLKKPLVLALEEARARLARTLGVSLDWLSFDSLLAAQGDSSSDIPVRSVRASSLLASLELAKDGQIEIMQSEAFAPIFLRRKSGEGEPSNLEVENGQKK